MERVRYAPIVNRLPGHPAVNSVPGMVVIEVPRNHPVFTAAPLEQYAFIDATMEAHNACSWPGFGPGCSVRVVIIGTMEPVRPRILEVSEMAPTAPAA